MNTKAIRKLLKNTTISYTARLGQEIKIDTKHSVCKPFGFYIGERVITPKGIATVIGVKVDGDGGGCLWVHVDGDAGASYWDNGVSEKDLIEKVGFKKSTEKLSYEVESVKMLIKSLAWSLAYGELPYFDIQEKDQLNFDDLQDRFRIVSKFFKCPDCGKPLRSHVECAVTRFQREDLEARNNLNTVTNPKYNKDKMKCPYCTEDIDADKYSEHIAICETQKNEIFNTSQQIFKVHHITIESFPIRSLDISSERSKSRVPMLTMLSLFKLYANWELYEPWNLFLLLAGEAWPPVMHSVVQKLQERCLDYIVTHHALFRKESRIHSLPNDLQDIVYRHAMRTALVFNTLEAAEAIEYLNTQNFGCKNIIDEQLQHKDTIIRLLHYGIMSDNTELVDICLKRLAKKTNLLDFQNLPGYDKLDGDVQRTLESKFLQIEPEKEAILEVEDPMESYISSLESQDEDDYDEDEYVDEDDEEQQYNSDDSTDL